MEYIFKIACLISAVACFGCGEAKSLRATPAPKLMDPNFCPYIDPVLPSECNGNSDCSTIKCGCNFDDYFAFTALATINACGNPGSLTVELDISKPISDNWSHTWSFDESEQVPVPGASVSILGFEAGLVVDGAIGGNAEALRVTIGFDVCAEVFGYKECGADLAYYVPPLSQYIPFVVVNHTFNLSDECDTVHAIIMRSPVNWNSTHAQAHKHAYAPAQINGAKNDIGGKGKPVTSSQFYSTKASPPSSSGKPKPSWSKNVPDPDHGALNSNAAAAKSHADGEKSSRG